jgi:hypothetical protein
MKNIILICLTWFLLSISAFSDLIPSDRIIDWSQAGVPSRSSGKSQLVTVKEAMKINDGTHWSASNEFVTITYDEDYGHEISLNN